MAYQIRSFHRSRIQHCVPAVYELHHRHLRAICRQCYGCKHILTFSTCLWTPLGRASHVPEYGCWACVQSLGWNILPGSACSDAIHKIWPKAKADVEIHVNCASKAIVASVRYKRVLPSPLSSS